MRRRDTRWARACAALLVALGALVLLGAPAALGGCSASAIRAQSYIAEGMDDATQQAREVVLEARADNLRDAGRRAQAEGRDVEAEVRDAAERFDAGPVIGAFNAFANAKNAYTRALLLALQERRPSFAALVPLAADVARSWASLRAALGQRGERLPEAPSFLTGAP